MNRTLEGKRALVLGGSRGIGAAIAKRLARDGANVALTYVSKPDDAQKTAAAIRELGGKALAIQADSANADAIVAAVDKTVQEFGGLDILVVNAGIVVVKPIQEFGVAELDRLLAINVRGVFVAVHAAAKHMKEGGRIITIGSCNAERAPNAGMSAYAMSKSALVGLVKGASRDLGPLGITINNVQPGPVDTDSNPAHGEFAEMLKGLMALPRYAQTEEIAGMVAYLTGPDAGFVTGASLTIDGGFTA